MQIRDTTRTVLEFMKKTYAEKALYLEYFTVAYNILEATAAIGFGFWYSSLSLEGFGFDSLIETISAITLIWRLRFETQKCPAHEIEKKEKLATKIVGSTFFVLGFYILANAIQDLYFHQAPQPSYAGVIIAMISIGVMIPLAIIKKQLAVQINSKALAADATETLICIYLSLILLIGSALYVALDWWWIDAIASMGMVVFIFKEGWEALFTETIPL